MQIRRTLAVGALSAVALGGFAAVPAQADAHLTCEGIEQAIDTAKDDFHAARKEFKKNQRPMGRLIKAERAEQRAEYRQSREAIDGLIREVKKAEGADRREAVKELKEERRDLAKSNRMLDSKRALRAAAKAERRAAKQEWKVAKEELRELKQFRSTHCEDGVEDTEETEVPETEETEVPDTEESEVPGTEETEVPETTV